MDFNLSADALEIQSATRRLVDDLLTLEPEFHRTGQPPEVAHRRFCEMGLHGITVPRAYGGLELDPVSSIVVQIELSRLPPQFWPLLRTGRDAPDCRPGSSCARLHPAPTLQAG